jgi:hypothetical protein
MNDESNGAAPEGAQPPAPAPTELALPEASCQLDTKRWRGVQDITKLRLAAGGAVFALVANPRARLLLPSTNPAAAAIEVEDSGVSLRGYVDSSAFRLHPARALVLAGFAVPSPFADLSWTGSQQAQVSVSYDIGPGVEPLRPLAATLPCDSFSIDYPSFEQADAIGDISQAKRGRLRLGRAIDLSAEPGGQVVARLQPKDEDDAEVKILDGSGRSTRILWWRPTALVFGWVAATEVRGLAAEARPGFLTGYTARALPRSSAIVERRRCEQDAALMAEVDGQRLKVGSVKSGTLLEVLRRDGEFVTIQTASRHIVAAPNAGLVVSAGEFESCAPAP